MATGGAMGRPARCGMRAMVLCLTLCVCGCVRGPTTDLAGSVGSDTPRAPGGKAADGEHYDEEHTTTVVEELQWASPVEPKKKDKKEKKKKKKKDKDKDDEPAADKPKKKKKKKEDKDGSGGESAEATPRDDDAPVVPLARRVTLINWSAVAPDRAGKPVEPLPESWRDYDDAPSSVVQETVVEETVVEDIEEEEA